MTGALPFQDNTSDTDRSILSILKNPTLIANSLGPVLSLLHSRCKVIQRHLGLLYEWALWTLTDLLPLGICSVLGVV